MRLPLALTSLLLAAHAGAATTYIGKPDCLIANPHPVEGEAARWEGPCKDGYADGMGVLNWSLRGEPHGGYEGMMVKGQPNGPGFLLLGDGSSLQGNFKDGLLEGKGIHTSAKGSKLSATFVAGVAAGIVDYTSPDGNVYHGQWRDNQPDGQGKMRYDAGGSYEGGWQEGEFSGKGVITYPNGVQLEREFQPQSPQAEPAAAVKYGLKQDQADTGTHIKHEAASGFSVPVELGYEQLSPQQRQLVKQDYKILQEDDEPPYPLRGPAAITRAFVEIQSKVQINGTFRLSVLIGEDGAPVSVTILEAPDAELGKVAGSVLMLSKYKPARCGGKPCAMRYNFNTRFILKL